MPKKSIPSKICKSCGRTFEWRKKWQNNWQDIKYCSKACGKRTVTNQDKKIETTILELLEKTEGSICPSQVARLHDPENWRDQMENVRRAARRLAAESKVIITQKGTVVDPTAFKGPIRIAMVRR